MLSVCSPQLRVAASATGNRRGSRLPSAVAKGSEGKPADLPDKWPTSRLTPEAAANPRFNIINISQWEKGVPPVMGSHLMASGVVAPISTSAGAGEAKPHMFNYPTAEGDAQVLLYPNKQSCGTGLAKVVAEASARAIQERGCFTVALSGGSLVDMLPFMFQLENRPDFSKWHVFYVDERLAPHSSPDSNHGAAKKAFLDRAGIPAAQIYAILEDATVEEAARAYEGLMMNPPKTVLARSPEGFPVLDMMLLGVGPDGHVASLFPNKAATAAKKGWVLPVSDSPKPPSERITMTMPVINSARDVLIVACGKGKAEVVQRALEVQALPGALPVQLVRPSNGKLRWLLDLEACADINPELWDSAKAFPRSAIGAAPSDE